LRKCRSLTKQQYNAGDDDRQGTEGNVDLGDARLASFGARRTTASADTLAHVAVICVDAPAAMAWIWQFHALVDWLAHRRSAAVLVAYQPPAVRAPAIKAVITIAIRLRYDYDPTTYRARLLPFDAIRREQKN